MLSAQAFIDGSVVAIDKPYGWTSFQVTSFVKHRVWRICDKRIKVGHAGTLDPLATGLVLVCTGKKTKEIERIQAGTKVYKASILLGATSASYDLETPVIQPDYVSCVPSEKAIFQALEEMTGEIEQMPPIFSAKKVGGKRAYEAARKNEEITLKRSLVTIHKLELNKLQFPYLDITVTCSKGTYIRSIAHDLGVLLGCGGVLTALRRIKSGDTDIIEAVSPVQFNQIIQEIT